MSEEHKEEHQTAANEKNGDSGKGSGRFPWWKIVSIVLLCGAIVLTLALKQMGTSSESQQKSPSADSPDAAVTRPQSAQEKDEAPEGKALGEDVLATIDDEPFTAADFQSALAQLPSAYSQARPQLKKQLLQELVRRRLLLQEADRQNIDTPPVRAGSSCCGPNPERARQNARIEALLRQEVLSGIEVDQDEMREYYVQNKDSYAQGQTFKDLKSQIKMVLRRKKENRAIDEYLSGLEEKANIEFADNPFSQNKETSADANPLERALNKDKPVLADFGRGECVPCKMMKPFLDELKKEYKGKAEILIIDTDDYRELTRRIGVRVLPTQVFYSADGEEVARHEGFMPREDIVKKLKEMGVE